MYIIFDTETTGLPKNWKAPVTDSDNWPRLVQLAWQLHEFDGSLVSTGNLTVKPDGFDIPYNSAKIHGITTEKALAEGIPLADVLNQFHEDLARAKYAVGHNVEFDINIVGGEYHRDNRDFEPVTLKKQLDTKEFGTDFCQIPGGRGGKFKWPTLTELHQKLFGEPFEDAHDAAYDVHATAKCFFGLIAHNVVPREEGIAQVTYEEPNLDQSNFEKAKGPTPSVSETAGVPDLPTEAVSDEVTDATFVHLHCHSQFSILQSTSTVYDLVGAAKKMGMPAIAITDHGNMMSTFSFVRAATKEGIKAIVGCEFNVCVDHTDKSHKDNGYQVVLIAKNKNGYQNLCKLSSKSFTDGSYYVPRIDKQLIETYKEDLIVLSGGLWGEISGKILNEGEKQAEEAFLWWKEQFGDDFYAEIIRHGVEEEDVVNKVILKLCKKHGVKPVATNNTYYTQQSEAEAHDILLCVKDAENVSTPKKYIGKRGREFRWGFPNDQFYVKSPEEMKQLFADVPEAILSTLEIEEKVEPFILERSVLLPEYDIPEEFIHGEDKEDGGKRGENAFLRHLTYEGAEERYGEITPEIAERLDFELETIAKTGYPGYFLIVQDFCHAAREMGVSVGPGRGSAAGSAVAYCNGITNIDPIKYDLLFERFLNPERVSMPDIDIDFDDEGRGRVIDYVIDKYGANQVAQIITYGTMAAKSSIRDTARVLELPLHEADRIAKLIPDMKLRKLFGMNEKELKSKLRNEDYDRAAELVKISEGYGEEANVINKARQLEGSVRNTGIHACGVIITPDDITNFVPVATAKDSDMVCTQYDNAVAEDAGLLKMDFLGLKTLTLIKDSVKLVKEKHGVDLDPDNFPLDDEKTYELFQRGDTIGIFQYESPGMQKHMRSLKPTVFADLIAMNALYRPGPMEYIPSFIARKHGTEEIIYDLDACEEYLKETYGITVYQEQVMLLSQKLAGFTKGEADTLRKAMGKKKLDLLAKMKPQFLDQGEAKGHDRATLEKIWKDWEAFASYAFNKSHSTCYAWIAYQTAYLKAHYPAEYMASVLSNNMNDIKTVSFFMEECKRMKIEVLGPDVNESAYKFRVNDEGAIRFGMGAIKGVGRNAIEHIVRERNENGHYTTIFNFIERMESKAVNKKSLEGLVYGGGFDSFGIKRSQYLALDSRNVPFIETLVKYGHSLREQANSSQVSMFGGESGDGDIPEPIIPQCEEWTPLERLTREKEVVGIFISGHPLDDFKLEIDHFTDANGYLKVLDPGSFNSREIKIAGILSDVQHRTTKTGKPMGIFNIDGYNESVKVMLFGDDYLNVKPVMENGWFVYLKGNMEPRRWGDPTQLELKVKSMELLTELRDKVAKGINIKFAIDQLNESLLEQLDFLTESEPGSCRINFSVKGSKEVLEFSSKSKSIRLSDEVIKRLDNIPEVEYNLVS
ncbi:MAG: DNA polymerase III subunit alpha [Flavobacteriales bacterium]